MLIFILTEHHFYKWLPGHWDCFSFLIVVIVRVSHLFYIICLCGVYSKCIAFNWSSPTNIIGDFAGWITWIRLGWLYHKSASWDVFLLLATIGIIGETWYKTLRHPNPPPPYVHLRPRVTPHHRQRLRAPATLLRAVLRRSSLRGDIDRRTCASATDKIDELRWLHWGPSDIGPPLATGILICILFSSAQTV